LSRAIFCLLIQAILWSAEVICSSSFLKFYLISNWAFLFTSTILSTRLNTLLKGYLKADTGMKIIFNSEWSIHFFTTYVHFRFGDLIREKMPLCIKNPGGSLYIQREQRA